MFNLTKGSFYTASIHSVGPLKALYTFVLPDRPVHSDTDSAFPGSILARQQLRAKTKSLTFPPLSIARYSCIQLSQQGRQWRERKCPIFETVPKGDSNPGSLDCESGILPLSYRAPQHVEEPEESIDERAKLIEYNISFVLSKDAMNCR